MVTELQSKKHDDCALAEEGASGVRQLLVLLFGESLLSDVR